MTTQHTTQNAKSVAETLAETAKRNFKPKKKKDSWESFHRKVRWGSHQYVDFVIRECNDFAKHGFGKCIIKVDKTTDLFAIDEGRGSCYSADFVTKLLYQKGFKFDMNHYIDHYDAIETMLVWCTDLPESPESIPMVWKKEED